MSNFAFFAYWGYQMYKEGITKFRAKVPKIYLILCLCGNKDKLMSELEQHKLMEENEFLREEYYHLLDDIKKAYYKGEMLLNRHRLDKLLIYLEDE